ncbi:hypothetical protein BDV96DRAFT_642431 [Lophiotrema nucula]|uniref:Integral membrane protein TmpA n=1 Tax=Lophiotrema nucula TaxID=690887 RepID=A0A6A5ZJV4_9PLEO|nr:hypothetical protein BDV96DRAFT_642431 [Lophiotrema nucula]
MPLRLPTFDRERRELQQEICYPDPVLPSLPDFTPALGFDVNDFGLTHDQVSKLQKAAIHRYPSYNSLDTTLSESTAPRKDAQWSELGADKLRLPPKHHGWLWRRFRKTFMSAYSRVFTLIVLSNLVGVLLLFQGTGIADIDLNVLGTWASTNFTVAILVRQDFWVNVIFRTAWLVPWSTPLILRRIVARVYALYGGIHSGAAIAGTLWFTGFTTLITLRFLGQEMYTLPIITLAWIIFAFLLSVLLFTAPCLRKRYHNTFELTHRFLGWTSILLFWTQLLLLTDQSSEHTGIDFGVVLVRQATFWNLSIITLMLMIPWLRLRRWTFVPEKLSSHAMRLHFSNPVHRFSCLSISTSPLLEWHPFATFPSIDSLQPGGSLVVSAAGDWTQSLINCPSPRTTFWIKGSPKAGVLSLSCIFRRVIFVTTGSGIGPCLGSLLDRPSGQFVRLIWSARSPLETFGKRLVQEVEVADPDAIIIDTDEIGRPDLLRIAWKMWKDLDAEAVFVLSNEKVTRKIVYGLENRGVPAFGPIFDS